MSDRNACDSPGLARFQQNMARYATGDMPVLSSGQVQKSPDQKAGEQFDVNCAAKISAMLPPAGRNRVRVFIRCWPRNFQRSR
jgi:hypothetical protein